MPTMLFTLIVGALAVSPTPLRCEAPSAPSVVVAAADSALQALYSSGQSFEVFLEQARARRAMWIKNWEGGVVPADALARARAIPGRWRLVVVAVDSCSDSVNTIPYLARLVSLVPGLEMRIVTPAAGKRFMELHRTPDGRAATPTVLVLDADGGDAGCWIERPSALQQLVIDARAAGKEDEFLKGKQSWYDTDSGASTIREVVAVIEGAASGKPVCAAKGAPGR